ncbi:hypothetical protein ARMSODRAFT_1090312 [Armillaria solidipes]|uniref:F-box domain-containing protein n=1 Tax=Armillaria solidipes TaxID=1076256 RepID=A0A2H3ANQ7_9AGAR|nr:hypothetical protein ARMSODRAFT_1090312 [Armillaria solidipes]
MALPTAFPSDWHPCKGCACVNHAIPSYRFSVTDADSPLIDHPDLGKLVRSNDAPNPSEEKVLQKMVSDTGKRIDALDAEVLELKALRQAFVQSIARVDEELATLDKERQRLYDSVRERRLLLSALRRMPKEVLAHIFFHTLDIPFPWAENPMSDGSWSQNSASKLSIFELVSRKWKDVLDTYPDLWSYVNILIDRMASSTYVCCIGNQLSRSRQCPLSILICTSESVSAYSLGAFPVAILMTLFTISSRVQTLHLCLPDSYFTDMQQPRLSFPILQELVLLSSTDLSEVAQHFHFGPLPCLRVFHARDISDIHNLSLPWHQLTHFTNSYTRLDCRPPAHRVLDILKTTSLLSNCSLYLYPSSRIEVVEETTLSKLYSLTLSSVCQHGFDFRPVTPFVLNSLKLPALSDLSVTCLHSNFISGQDTFTSIRHLIERSHSPLTSLYFDNGDLIEDDLIHILSNTPTLQDLRLTKVDGGITDGVLNHLARVVDTEPDSQVPALVPHLHTLHLSGRSYFQMEAYVQMVERRWACHPRHLKSVDICRTLSQWWYDDPEEEANLLTLSRLDDLESEGLHVVMSTED